MRQFFLIAVLFLAGCVTGYHPVAFTGGFTDSQLGENVFRVTFKGNAYTSRDRVADLNLLRCAEVALEHGFKYFVLADSQGYSQGGSITMPGTSYSTGNAYVYGNQIYGSGTTTHYGGYTVMVNKPVVVSMIVCTNEEPDTMYFNAEFLVKSIKSKYQLK